MIGARLLSASLLVLACAAVAGAQPPMQYLAGQHYTRLSEPAPTRSQPGVDVIEFFLYSCPHCYAFDPNIRQWVEQLPEFANFRRVPVMFGPHGRTYARIFYTAKVLGVLDQLHKDIFDAIHQRGRPLVKRDAIRAFFVEHGVDAAAFDRVFDSEKVAARVDKAAALARAYKVMSVPSIGVAGRYWVNSGQAGGNKAMLPIAEFLISRTHARHQG